MIDSCCNKMILEALWMDDLEPYSQHILPWSTKHTLYHRFVPFTTNSATRAF